MALDVAGKCQALTPLIPPLSDPLCHMSLSLAGGLLCRNGEMPKLNAIRMYSLVFKGLFSCLISYVSWPWQRRTTPTCWAIKPQTLKADKGEGMNGSGSGRERERDSKGGLVRVRQPERAEKSQRAQAALWIYVKLQMNTYTNTNTNTIRKRLGIRVQWATHTPHTHTHEIHTPITLKYECDMHQRGAASGDEIEEFVLATL